MGNDVNAYEILLARFNQLDSQVKAFMQAASLDLEDVHNRIETLFQLLDREKGEEKGEGDRGGEGDREEEETLSLTPSSLSTPSFSSDNEVKDLLKELIQEVKELKMVKSQEGVASKIENSNATVTPKKRGRPRKNPVQEVATEEMTNTVDTTPQSFYAWEGTFPDPREYKAVK